MNAKIQSFEEERSQEGAQDETDAVKKQEDQEFNESYGNAARVYAELTDKSAELDAKLSDY